MAFALLHFIPGDPVDLMLGEQATLEDRASLRHELGLDQPLTTQFGRYAWNILRFDFNRSLVTREPAGREILKRLPATIELSLAALMLAVLWGIPLGVWAAVRPRSFWDRLADGSALLGVSVPGVFLGPALVYVFSIQLDWFPVSDRGGPEYLVLPALSLAIPLGAVLLRMTRAAVLEVLSEDYIRTARAKGLGDGAVYFKHTLRNALSPVVTILCLQLAALLTGTVITETIFDWPGIGSLLFSAIQRRDYPVVQASILMIATIYVLVNLLGDLLYAALNPRVRDSLRGDA